MDNKASCYRVPKWRSVLYRAVSRMQEFIGDEDVVEGNERASKHFVSTILYIVDNFNAQVKESYSSWTTLAWRWRHYIPFRCEELSAHLHGLTPQKNKVFMLVIFFLLVWIRNSCLNKFVCLTYQLYTWSLKMIDLISRCNNFYGLVGTCSSVG